MVTEAQVMEGRIAAGQLMEVRYGERSFLQPSRANRRGRHLGIEHAARQMRRRRDYHKVLAELISTGRLDMAVAEPALSKMILAGGAEGQSMQGFPAAAGGVDVSAALTSVRPGIRKIKKRITSVPIAPQQQEIPIELPNSGYLEQVKIRIKGTIKIVQAAEAHAITMNDIRNLVQRIRIELSSTVVPKSLTGLQEDIIDALDLPVTTANINKVPTSGELTGAGGSTVEKEFTLEFSPRLTVSDQNLYGIPYLGAISTTPKIVILLNPLLGPAGSSPMSAAAAGPTATLVNTTVQVDGWRIDLPGPVAPSSTSDAEGHTVEIPGEGLWAEAGYLLKSAVIDSQDQVSAGLEKRFHIPIGPMYTRLILLAYVGGILDTETGGTGAILERTELGVQEATVIEARYPEDYSSDYRNAYYKTRPTGVYVNSGIDQSGTDEDLWVTQDLGNFTFTCFTSQKANGEAGTKYELLGQSLAPLSRPGLYA